MSSMIQSIIDAANNLMIASPAHNNPPPIDLHQETDVPPESDVPPSSSRTSRHFPSPATITSLNELGVPLSINPQSKSSDCSACEDPCSVPMNSDGYPTNGFSIDTITPLLGTVKPFDYLILCSSGKSDWPHDVCKDKTSVPGALRNAYPKAKASGPAPTTNPNLAGLYPLPAHLSHRDGPGLEESRPLQVAILSSSHFSTSAAAEGHSLIIFPDWIRVTDVTPSSLPKLGHVSSIRAAGNSNRLPHEVIILLCSHKTRDKRCAISAPILEESLSDAIENQGSDWKIDLRGDYEDGEGHRAEEERLVGIFRVSHTGGHKFAGNVIINFPSGITVWYGRVTPADCKRIVQETIIERKVIPELLKGGIGLPELSHSNALKW